jgi:hypothetical protein
MAIVNPIGAFDRTYSNKAQGNAVNINGALATTLGIVASNQATALQIGDVVNVAVIPAGTRIVDFVATVSAAFTALTTCSIGYADCVPTDPAAVVANPTYFAAAGAVLNAVGVLRKTTTNAPVVLARDVFVTVTLAGAAQAATSRLDIDIYGQIVGHVNS